MNIYYNNIIYFFQNNDYEKNIIYLKLKNKYGFDDTKTNSIVNLYISKKRCNCTYSDNIEKMICNYINEIL